MKSIVDKFGGKRMETYHGEDITPLWDLKGEGLPWSYKYLYAAPKLEKIVFAVQSFRDKLMSYATGIWPDDVHALPIFSAYWAESAKGTYFVVDFYPTADCICDIPYMEHYLEPHGILSFTMVGKELQLVSSPIFSLLFIRRLLPKHKRNTGVYS
jgi:hypothetical protein